MFVRRLYSSSLAQYSYLVGCPRTHEAIVIDPTRDTAPYLQAAKEENARITHVTETHIHADFVSGVRELAAATGARMWLSDAGPEEWKYQFAEAAGAGLLQQGSRIEVGDVLLEAVHTPGHTPEHLSLLLTDRASANAPMAAATGDFIFVGDVGRPDLLERAAGHRGTMEAAARTLFRSLEQFSKAQPDWLQIWPGHGAGSACGRGMSAIPQSTLGYEKRFNWAFLMPGEEYFVASILDGQPDPPRYFAEMKRVNKAGPRVLGAWPSPPRLDLVALDRLLAAGATIVDTRPGGEFAVGHIPRTISLPAGSSFTTWAGAVLPYNEDLYLIVDGQPGRLEPIVRDLALIGLDRLGGYFESGVIDAWAAASRPVGSSPQILAEDLAESLRYGGIAVVDVRSHAEWTAGHIAGAQHIPLTELPARFDEVPKQRAVAVHCAGGLRSGISASLLRAHGVDRVLDLAGGLAAWRRAGLPITRAGER